MVAPLRSAAGLLADRSVLPTSVRAAVGYYADTGTVDVDSLRLQGTVDDRSEAMIESVFDPVEAAIADAFDAPEVTFSYDTKLVLPAQLTLGHIYRKARARAPAGSDPVELGPWADRGDRGPASFTDALAAVDWDSDPDPQELVDRAELFTRLVVEALIDGDMRDAVNDAEYEDFEVSIDLSEGERAEVARLAQETLQAELAGRFDAVPDGVIEAYDWAVEVSEAHQDRDEHFRALYERAREGEADAATAIREEYRDAALETETDVFDAETRSLPYLKTQYARVGVIYDGMIEMYRAAGLPVDTAFKRSIVLSIIGAQIWLDDVDDYPADVADGQLTPVTAEYVLADIDGAAYESVRSITDDYLDLAKRYAAESDAPLAGIAAEYIYRSGDPSVLPR